MVCWLFEVEDHNPFSRQSRPSLLFLKWVQLSFVTARIVYSCDYDGAIWMRILRVREEGRFCKLGKHNQPRKTTLVSSSRNLTPKLAGEQQRVVCFRYYSILHDRVTETRMGNVKRSVYPRRVSLCKQTKDCALRPTFSPFSATAEGFYLVNGMLSAMHSKPFPYLRLCLQLRGVHSDESR